MLSHESLKVPEYLHSENPSKTLMFIQIWIPTWEGDEICT